MIELAADIAGKEGIGHAISRLAYALGLYENWQRFSLQIEGLREIEWANSRVQRRKDILRLEGELSRLPSLAPGLTHGKIGLTLRATNGRIAVIILCTRMWHTLWYTVLPCCEKLFIINELGDGSNPVARSKILFTRSSFLAAILALKWRNIIRATGTSLNLTTE
jgi:hypothetical protein